MSKNDWFKKQKQFVTYEIALAMKELGFDEPCFGYFEGKNNHRIWFEMSNNGVGSIPVDDVLSPLWSQCIDWFREKHKIFIEIRFADKALTEYEFVVFQTWGEYVNNITDKIMGGDDRPTYTYEEAREKAILKAIELVN